MPAFVYRARDPAGNLVRGRVEAEALPDVITRLRAQGLLVVHVDVDRDLGRALWSAPFGPRPLRGSELALFLRQLATMVQAGLPVVTALKVLARQSRRRATRRALEQAVAAVEAGETLAGAFARSGLLPRLLVHMVGAGEVGGILDRVLDRLATQVEREEQVRRRIRAALTYPLVVSGLAVLVVAFLVTFVVPRFAQFFAEMGGELPLPTRVLLAVAGWVQRWCWAVPLALAGGWLALRRLAASERIGPALDDLVLRLPVLGPLLAKHAIARLCRILSGLMASGIPILKALAVAERAVGNRRLAQAVLAALESVRRGEGLAPPLARSGLFPPMVIEMVSVGEETGTLETMLAKVAEFYEGEVQAATERLAGALEPFVIAFLALVVGGVVLSMVTPIFDLWTVIGK